MRFKEGAEMPKREPESMKNVRETILARAIEYRGEVFTGVNHSLALLELKKARPDITWRRDIRAGFLTTKGKFVDMNEGVQMLRQEKKARNSRNTPGKTLG